MATHIQLHRSCVEGATPDVETMLEGEPAVNLADKKLWVKGCTGELVTMIGGISAQHVAGSSGQIQFNANDGFSANSYFVIDSSAEPPQIGIGTSSPREALEVVGTIHATGISADGATFGGNVKMTSSLGVGTSSPRSTIEAAGVVMGAGFSGATGYFSAGITAEYIWGVNPTSQYIRFDPEDKQIFFDNNGKEYMRLTSFQEGLSLLDQVVVNETGTQVDFRVEGDDSTHLIFTRAADNKVGILTATPQESLHVVGNIQASAGVCGATGVFGTNLGVGTSSPRETLEVVGTVLATGISADGATFSGNVILSGGATFGNDIYMGGNYHFRNSAGNSVIDFEANTNLELGDVDDVGNDTSLYIRDSHSSIILNADGAITLGTPIVYIDEELRHDGDVDTKLRFETDTISLLAGGVTFARGTANGVLHAPVGISADGATFGSTVTATGFVGALTGNVTGNASGTAATVTTAAQGNITSVGTLTALTMGGELSCADNLVTRPKLKDYAETVNAIGTVTSDTAVDVADGNVQTVTVGGDCIFSFENFPADGIAGTVTLIITNGGAYTTTWKAHGSQLIKWPGDNAPALTASGVDIITFTTIDAGVITYGFVGGINFS